MKPGDILTTLDADIAKHERCLTLLRSTRAQLVEIYGVDTVVAEAPTATPARVSRPKGGNRSAAARSAADDGRQRQRELAKATVLAWLQKRTGPVALTDIVEGTALSMYRVNGAVDALVHDRAIVRRGKTSQSRIGLPAVMAAKEDL